MIDTDEIRDNLHIYESLVHGTLRALCDEIDRLRGEHQTPPQGRTVEFRFNAYIDTKGNVEIPFCTLTPGRNTYQCEPTMDGIIVKLTATLPVPAEVEVVARVEGE